MGLLDSGFMPVRGAAYADEEQRRVREIISMGVPAAYAAYRTAAGTRPGLRGRLRG